MTLFASGGSGPPPDVSHWPVVVVALAIAAVVLAVRGLRSRLANRSHKHRS